MKTVWIINQFAGTPKTGANQRHFHLVNTGKVKVIKWSLSQTVITT